MGSPRIPSSAPSCTSGPLDTASDVASAGPLVKPVTSPPTREGARSTVEPFQSRPFSAIPQDAPDAPREGPVSRAAPFDLKQALEQQRLQEASMGELAAQVKLSAKRGRIDGYTFHLGDAPNVKEGLQKLTPDQFEAAVREAVARGFPDAGASKLKSLTAEAMHELKKAATTEMAREYKGFICGKLSAGAAAFRDVAKDPARVQTMLDRLAAMPASERAAAAAALGLPAEKTRPTAAELSAALVDRAALMDRSAKELSNVSGADHTSYRLASYPGLEEAFLKSRGIAPDSMSGRAMSRVMTEAQDEKTLRGRLDFTLAVGTAMFGGGLVTAAGLGTAGAVAIAAPGTLLTTSRKFGEASEEVEAARAGEAAGVMGRGRIANAELHRNAAVVAGAAELVAPAAVHGVAKLIAPHAAPAVPTAVQIAKGALKGGAEAAVIPGAEAGAVHALHEQQQAPTGADATKR